MLDDMEPKFGAPNLKLLVLSRAVVAIADIFVVTVFDVLIIFAAGFISTSSCFAESYV